MLVKVTRIFFASICLVIVLRLIYQHRHNHGKYEVNGRVYLKKVTDKSDALPLVILNTPTEERQLPQERQRFPQAFLLGAGKCGTGI